MNFVTKRKLLKTFATGLIVATPIATVISCTSKQATAAENRLNHLMTSEKIKILSKLLLFETIVNEEYKAQGWDDIRKEKALEEAWNVWALNKMKSQNNFWVSEVNRLVANGTVDKTVFEIKGTNGNYNWKPSISAKGILPPISVGQTLKSGYYPDYTIGKEIMKNHRELGWGLEIYKLLATELFFTTIKEEELMTKNEVEDVQRSDSTKQDKKDLARKLGGKWFKEQGDQPSLFLRGERKLKTKTYNQKYFFLNKYLFDNKPQLVWEKKGEARQIAGSSIKLTDAASFNSVNPEQKDLLAPKRIFSNNIIEDTVDGWAATTKTLLEGLEGFKGFSSPAVSDKGDVDTTIQGLKGRLSDNSSKTGFLNEKGMLKAQNDVIVKDGVKAQYVQQFLPHFVAYNVKSVEITTQEAQRSVIELSSGIHTSVAGKIRKYDKSKDSKDLYKGKDGWYFDDDLYNDTTKYVMVKKDLNSSQQDDDDFYDVKKNGKKTKWIQLHWDAKHKIDNAYFSDQQQMISDKENLSFVEEGSKSFFYADSKLLADKDRLRKVIFQFAINSPSIVSDAQKFMVNVRGYELTVYTPKIRKALKGLGLWKED